MTRYSLSTNTRRAGPTIGRRLFLQQLLAASAAGTLASCGRFGGDAAAATPNFAAPQAGIEPLTVGNRIDSRADGRILVVIDLQGGNDGLNTVIPAGASQYYDLRPDNAIPDDEVLTLTNDFGLNPNLELLHARGLAHVGGVGPVGGTLSHFAMEDRWARGDVDGEGHQRDGFLGRLINSVATDNPLTGVSLSGTTPHFFGSGSASLSLSDPNALWFMEQTDWEEALIFQRALQSFDGEALGEMVGDGYGILATVAKQLEALSDDYDEAVAKRFENAGDLGSQLQTAGLLIDGGVDTTIFYAQMGGYDTHTYHRGNHDQLMGELDRSIGAFLDWMDDLGRSDDVVVATVSEFGRRVEENGTGLDHGAASTMLLAGAVSPGSYGEPSPLDDLDDDGNLRTMVSFDRYLATLAEEWLGVEASSILPNEPKPLGIW